MLGEIIEEILLIQNVRIDRSVSYADKRERVTFSLMKILQEEKVVSAIQRILDVVGFSCYQKSVLDLSIIIQNVLKTTKYPLHIVGFGLNNKLIYQLKIYYTFAIFNKIPEGSKYVMAHYDNNLSKAAIKKVLNTLDLVEKEGQIVSIIDSMIEDDFCLDFIGINIAKERPPDLKLYFKQRTNSME